MKNKYCKGESTLWGPPFGTLLGLVSKGVIVVCFHSLAFEPNMFSIGVITLPNQLVVEPKSNSSTRWAWW